MKRVKPMAQFVCSAVAVLVGAVMLVSPAAQVGDAALSDRVRAVHAAAKPLDAHADVLMPTTSAIYRTADGASQVSVDKLVAGGMATITLAIQSATGPNTAEAVATARREVDAKLARIRDLVAANPDRLALARNAADLERIHAGNKIAVLIGFQNAYALGTDQSLVARYVDQGVRVFAFNHAGNNAFADSSRPTVPGDEPNGGLSPLGRSALRTLNDRGVVIDVSQLTPKGVMQTLELSRAPVIASHSAVRSSDRRDAQPARRRARCDRCQGRRGARAAVQYLHRSAAAGLRGTSWKDSDRLRLTCAVSRCPG